MRYGCRVIGLIAAAAAMGVVGAAMGQVEPSATRAAVGGWKLTALVDRGDNSTVTGILALRDTTGLSGDNISAVWYARDASDPGHWESMAWSGIAEWEAVEWVKKTREVSECADAAWATFGPKLGWEGSVTPEAYVKGFAASDPAYELVEASIDRDSMVKTLESSGYKVADMPLESKTDLGDGEDRTDLILSAIAAAVQSQEASSGSDEFSAEFTKQFQASFAISWFCYPISYTVPGGWSAWTPGGWVLHPCSVSIGGSPVCCYDMQVCRSRTIVEYTVNWDCTVGVSNTWTENECWTHTGWCTNAGGGCPAVPACSLALPSTPGNRPPPGVCPTRTTVY